ncbi:hypothetical protein [uncultured Photobacterium sp.]|uniref:hypothetical protein n=1 Tax=uncultured Photobacterium sp. TaxID=173973 RepID=UPI00261B36A9|nr:hypothetical protein [uncultured Photobacterium sp.]
MNSLKKYIFIATLLISKQSYSIESNAIGLPFNEYNALQLLAKWKVSTIELPTYISNVHSDIYGEDNNKNQLRDDYEKVLLSIYQRPEYVVMGLLAAKKWDRLLDIYSNSLIIEDTNQAKEILAESLAINRCYYHLQTIDNNLSSPVLAYFNTDQRINAKKEAELKLISLIGNQQESLSLNRQSCRVFNTMLKTALNTEAHAELNY